MPTAKLCKRKRGDTSAYREDREIKIIRNRVCAQTRSLAKRGHIDRFEKNRNGGIIYIKTRSKPFPCKMTIKLKSAWRKNRFDGFPVPPLLFCPAISPRYFAPAISLPPFRANKTIRKAKEKLSHTLKPNNHGKGRSEALKQNNSQTHKQGRCAETAMPWIAARL